MSDIGKILIFLGILLIVVGLFISLVGKLPGDIYIKRDNFVFFFPITTSIVISIVFSLLFYIFFKYFR